MTAFILYQGQIAWRTGWVLLEAAGLGYVAASAASADHHAWSAAPWTRRFHLSLRGGAPCHPYAAGMRAVAGLIVGALAS